MRTKNKNIQGTAALIIGVVFVVIAGLIFATTTWHTLPNISKVIMALGFSGLFFLISELARKIFKIEKTSQAFYILGSVFLFIMVLAVGYFRLLGDGFTMGELQRFRVLCAGSIVTELALISGVKRFADRIYTRACFLGLSIIVYFFVRAMNFGIVVSINAMMIYSFGLVLLDVLTVKSRETMPEYLNAGFSCFARLHFLLFSVILVVMMLFVFFINMIQLLLTKEVTILLSAVMAIGAMVAGLTVLVLKDKKLYLKIFRSIGAVVFVHYLGMWFHVGFIYQVLISALLMGVLFFAESQKKNPVGCEGGNWIYTIVFMMDTGLIMLLAFLKWDSLGALLAATSVILLTAAAAVIWGKKYAVIRCFVPVLLCPVTLTVTGLLHHVGGTNVSLELAVLLFLAAVCVWDLKQKDCFMKSILLIGTMGELFFWAVDGKIPLFAICLSVYLLFKSHTADGRHKEEYEKGGCLYLLMGIFFIADRLFASHFVSLLCTTAVYVVEYILFNWRRKEKNDDMFWMTTGLVFFLCDTAAFYLDDSLSAVYIIAILLVFAAFYIMLYKRGKDWMSLLATLWIMPMPVAAICRYGLGGDQLYGFMAIAIVLAGILIHRFVPLITFREEGGSICNCNWFNMFVIIVILPMTILAKEGWRSVYLFIMALYVLQYIVIKSLQKSALTLAAALVLTAAWTQPWLKYPTLIYLEIQLLLAALFIRSLTYIWKDKKSITNIQMVLYCMCLTILAGDAVRTGLVADALILEAVCLVTFVLATIRKHILWQRISGSIIIGVVIYMTKTFWLSLAWWVYLLAAGIGLIVFAAVNEKKKK